MADNDFNIIKPVESLQNVGGMNPVERRKERKHKQNLKKQNRQEQKQELNEPTEEDLNDETSKNEDDQHSIDYCA